MFKKKNASKSNQNDLSTNSDEVLQEDVSNLKNKEQCENLENKSHVIEIERMQKNCEEYLAGWQRAKADYINFKKETESRQKEFAQFANASLIAELIPVYDNFKKAFACAPKDENKEWQNWMVGIGYIKKQMADFIAKFGIEEIKTVGEKFDPQFHESIGKEKIEGKEEGVIIKEINPGYTMHGKVLTPAKVIISE